MNHVQKGLSEENHASKLETMANQYSSATLHEVKSIQELTDAGLLEQFLHVYSRIPENERLSINVLKDRIENTSGSLGNDRYHLIIAKHDNEILGYSAGRWFSDIDTGFVSFLGTQQKIERNGVGHKVRNELINTYMKDSLSQNRQLNTVVGEIASDNPLYLSRMIKRADISFLDIDYSQGAYDDLQAGVPLNLYVQVIDPPTREYKGNKLFKEVLIEDNDGQKVKRYALHKNYVKELANTIYQKIYKNNNSPEFLRTMESIDKYGEYVMPHIPKL